MRIIVVGMNHETAPVEVREKLSYTSSSLKRALTRLRPNENQSNATVSEAVILFTCNRMEIYAAVDDLEQGKAAIYSFLTDVHDFAPEEFTDHLYVHLDTDAVSHLFCVASGLDSMILGETEVLGQTVDAYETALSKNTTGPVLSSLFQKGIHVGKRARSETAISQNAASVSHAAVELARQIFGDLADCQVLVIGAGEMGELAAKNLMDNGAKGIIVANRTYHRAVTLAKRWEGEALNFDRVTEALWNVDIVISSTGAPHPILKAEMMREVMWMRRNQPLFLIDIAVPRDVEPTVGEMDNVYLYDIDDLEGVVEDNLQQRAKEIPKVEAIIEEEALSFMRHFRSLDVVPTIADLRKQAEGIRQAELDKALRRLGEIPEHDQEVVSAMSAAIVNKLLHEPTIRLKEHANSGDGYTYSEVVRDLFVLDDDKED